MIALPFGAQACGTDHESATSAGDGGAGRDAGLEVGTTARGGSGGGGAAAGVGAKDGGEAGAGGFGATDAGSSDASTDAPLRDAGVHPPRLTLTLDPSLNGDNDVKASALTSAVLMSTSGDTVRTARILGNNAVFDLTALTAGDYFIEVNGDADDLVPTRIDDPSTDIDQRVAQALCASYVGTTAAPIYRINTYSTGQGHGPAVKFSDGAPIPGEQPYLVINLALPKVEVRELGTGALLSSTILEVGTHGSQLPFLEPFDDWLLNTTDRDHHGDAFNADGGATICESCHVNMNTKPATYDAITSTNGYCYRCHNGSDGDEAGFVDAMK